MTPDGDDGERDGQTTDGRKGGLNGSRLNPCPPAIAQRLAGWAGAWPWRATLACLLPIFFSPLLRVGGDIVSGHSFFPLPIPHPLPSLTTTLLLRAVFKPSFN